ncbi:MAG: SPOR domain-containing protein [Vicinamibacterales bacterium]
MADEAFHEIQLSGKHLVALFMAATVVAVVVFLCGVMVGRGISAERLAIAEAAARETPVDPTAEARAPDTPVPEATSSTPQAASPASQETLSYPDRLAGSGPPEESLKDPGAARLTRSAPAASSAPAAPGPVARSAPDGPGAASARTVGGATDAPSAPFVVQVAAVRERGEAERIAKRLTTKGYPAFVMAPASGAPRVFRVRVGTFPNRREAEQVARRLEREEHFKPWITR